MALLSLRVLFIAVVALVAATRPSEASVRKGLAIFGNTCLNSTMKRKWILWKAQPHKLLRECESSYDSRSCLVKIDGIISTNFPMTIQSNAGLMATYFSKLHDPEHKPIADTRTPGMAQTLDNTVVVRLLDSKTIDYIGASSHVFLASRVSQLFGDEFQKYFFDMLQERSNPEALIFAGKDSEPAFLGTVDNNAQQIHLHVPDNTVFAEGETDIGRDRVFRMTHFATHPETRKSELFSLDLVMSGQPYFRKTHHNEKYIPFGLDDMCLLFRTNHNQIFGGCMASWESASDISVKDRAHGVDVENVLYDGPSRTEAMEHWRKDIQEKKKKKNTQDLTQEKSHETKHLVRPGPRPTDMLSQLFNRFNPSFDVYDKYVGDKGFAHREFIGNQWAFQLLPKQSAFVARLDPDNGQIHVNNDKETAKAGSVYKGYSTEKGNDGHPLFYELELNLNNLNTEELSTSFPLEKATLYQRDASGNRVNLGKMTKDAAMNYGSRDFVLYAPSDAVPCHTLGSPDDDEYSGGILENSLRFADHDEYSGGILENSLKSNSDLGGIEPPPNKHVNPSVRNSEKPLLDRGDLLKGSGSNIRGSKGIGAKLKGHQTSHGGSDNDELLDLQDLLKDPKAGEESEK